MRAYRMAANYARSWGVVAFVLLLCNLFLDTSFDGVIGALILSQLWSVGAVILARLDTKPKTKG